jgi:hypothetical protein
MECQKGMETVRRWEQKKAMLTVTWMEILLGHPMDQLLDCLKDAALDFLLVYLLAVE